MGEPILGLLLAGGQSRRMGGGDKCLLPLAGRPLLAHVIARLEPQVDRMVLNANGDPARFSAFDLPVTADPIEGFAGPLAGVLAGFRWAENHAPDVRWVMTVAADTPFFPDHLAADLIAATDGKYPAIALAASGGRSHPVFGLWPVALADNLGKALDDGVRKVLDWTDRHHTGIAEFTSTRIGDRDVDPFFNANRPDDLAEAEALLASEPQ